MRWFRRPAVRSSRRPSRATASVVCALEPRTLLSALTISIDVPETTVPQGGTLAFDTVVTGGSGSYERTSWVRRIDQPWWRRAEPPTASLDGAVAIGSAEPGRYRLLVGVTDTDAPESRPVYASAVFDVLPGESLSIEAMQPVLRRGETLAVAATLQGIDAGEVDWFARTKSGLWQTITPTAQPDGSLLFDVSEQPAALHMLFAGVRDAGGGWAHYQTIDFDIRENAADLQARLLDGYLADDLYEDDLAYDAVNVLMVPMHAAFAEASVDGDLSRVQPYADLFDRWLAAGGTYAENRVIRSQWTYLATRFLAESHDLAAATGQPSIAPAGLFEHLAGSVESLWQQEEAWAYHRDSFAGGIAERTVWRLALTDPTHSYQRAFLDEDFFTFAAAADLARVGRSLATTPLHQSALEAAALAGVDVLRAESFVGPDGRWHFQPGAWAEHPDYVYAGHTVAAADMPPAPIADIGWDTGHAHRMPLWFRSLRDGAADPADAAFMQSTLDAFESHFFANVLVEPTGETDNYRTTNYLSGDNGLYRYNYRNRAGRDELPFRYEPNEVSGVLVFGWWSFFDTDRSAALFESIQRRFALDAATLADYIGPDSPRVQHPILQDGAVFTNGLAELMTMRAARRWS